jgi:anti-sigma-K factor RskA
MPTYLLDDLSVEEKEALRAHLQTNCPRCAAALAEAQAVFAQMSLAVTPVEPPPSVREKLMQRVAAAAAEKPLRLPPAKISDSRGRSMLPWAFGLAASIAAICLGIWANRQHDAAQALQTQLADTRAHANTLETTVEQQQASMQRMGSPDVQVISLKGTPKQSAATARIFLDRKNALIEFAASGLNPPPPGKTYELWIVTPDQKKMPVGTFDVNPNGDGFLRASVPSTSVALAAVTDEPRLMPQPTGSFQLIGKVEAAQ